MYPCLWAAMVFLRWCGYIHLRGRLHLETLHSFLSLGYHNRIAFHVHTLLQKFFAFALGIFNPGLAFMNVNFCILLLRAVLKMCG